MFKKKRIIKFIFHNKTTDINSLLSQNNERQQKKMDKTDGSLKSTSETTKWKAVGDDCPYEHVCGVHKKEEGFVSMEFGSRRISFFEHEEKMDQLWTLLWFLQSSKKFKDGVPKIEIINALKKDFKCADVEAGKRTKSLFREIELQLDLLLEMGVKDDAITKTCV